MKATSVKHGQLGGWCNSACGIHSLKAGAAAHRRLAPMRGGTACRPLSRDPREATSRTADRGAPGRPQEPRSRHAARGAWDATLTVPCPEEARIPAAARLSVRIGTEC